MSISANICYFLAVDKYNEVAFVLNRLSWAGLLPIARLVEDTPAGWVEVEADEEGEPARDVRHEKSRRVFVDKSLLSCLVDRWRPETHTFHFRWGEMAPTLQDVSYLLGLPLAGCAIGPLGKPAHWRTEMQARYNAVRQGNIELPESPHGPRVSWLSAFEVRLYVV